MMEYVFEYFSIWRLKKGILASELQGQKSMEAFLETNEIQLDWNKWSSKSLWAKLRKPDKSGKMFCLGSSYSHFSAVLRTGYLNWKK